MNGPKKEEHRPAHSCEHLLNAYMVKHFGCPRSRNAHSEKKKCKCDYILEQCPTEEQVAAIEVEMNRLIALSLPVTIVNLSKLPEGIAAGVGFNAAESSDAWAVTLGIALQNIPEGMVVIAPLLVAGVSELRTFIISLAIALLEIVGVRLGYGIGAISAILLPVMLAMAGGAMLYIVSDEMIPETHAHGYQKMTTYSLILGFITLVFLEMAF